MRDWWIIFITDWKLAAQEGGLLKRFLLLGATVIVLALLLVLLSRPAWQTMGTTPCGEVSATIVAEHGHQRLLYGPTLSYTAQDSDGNYYSFRLGGAPPTVGDEVIVERRCNRDGSVRRNPVGVRRVAAD